MYGLHTNALAALFPPPRFLAMPAAGIDISDSSIKYFEAHLTRAGFIPHEIDVKRLPSGVIVNGEIVESEQLSAALCELHEQHGKRFANVALPEELVYLYTLEVPAAHKHKEIMQVIEFSLNEHVPITVENAIFNYDVIRSNGSITELSVTVFSKDIVEAYVDVFEKSGFEVKAFELEAHSVARAVIPRNSTGVSMIIDFGRTRTGITIAFGRIPVFSTTVKIGGDTFTESIMRHLKVSEEVADDIKWNEGIVGCSNDALCNELRQAIDTLVKEVQRHYRYWNTRRDEDGNTIAPIESAYLCGGALAMRGLKEHITDMLQVPVCEGDVWGNMLDINEYVPEIPKERSWGYATAVGLFLRDTI